MQDYIHVQFDERRFFKDLFLSDSCKKKTAPQKVSKIKKELY
nr:hypothetical protein [Spiroplasma endosymbiont of Megaselia nigra]